jgi:hypothetical protein
MQFITLASAAPAPAPAHNGAPVDPTRPDPTTRGNPLGYFTTAAPAYATSAIYSSRKSS